MTDHQENGNGQRERTLALLLIKPLSIQRSLVGEIIQRFEKKGFKLVGLKLVQAREDQVRRHYAKSRGQSYFEALVKSMLTGPIIPMIWEGHNVIRTTRQMLGVGEPDKSMPGTIRGDFGIQIRYHLHDRTLHGADCAEDAQREIGIWFKPGELMSYPSTLDTWFYLYE